MSSTGMQSQSTSDDGHGKSLSDLCRICSKIIDSEVTCYEVCTFKEQLDTAFSINCAADSSDIHPPRFCLNCYASIMHSEKRGSVLTFPAATWEPHSLNDCLTCKLRSVKSKGGRPKKKSKNAGRPKSVIDIRDVMKLDVNSPIPSSLQKAASHILALQAKQSPKQIIELKTGGPNPMRFVPVTVARIDSTEASKRTVRARSQQIKNYSKMVSGGSREGLATQTAHVVKGMDAKEREDILKTFKQTVSVPADAVASMKSVLGLPWNLVRDVRRWLQTFNVKLAAEGQVREVVKDWVGAGLRSEEIPATFIKDNKVSIKLIPWCYIYNLVGFVLHYLDGLKNTNLLMDIPFIPPNEIFLKVGGDHGGGSFKMSFQVANVANPNKPENTVVFSVMEAKDYKSNLMLCLERFKGHISKFTEVKWSDHCFRLFLFGDYEFLCTMYGLSGASGRHPCLWCHITKDKLGVPLCDRAGMFKPRSLGTLRSDLKNFVDRYNSNLLKAKLANNVISDVFFEIPLENVCIPGLHITLGVYMKLFHELEHFAKQLDIKIAEKLASERNLIDSTELGEFVVNLNVIVDGEKNIQELEERRTLLLEELSWFMLTQDELFDEDFHRNLLTEINSEIEEETQRIEEARRLTKELNSGPCFSSLDKTLYKIGVERAKYFGGTIVGNDCHKLLKPANVSTLCDSMVTVLNENITDNELTVTALQTTKQFKLLFSKYASCHNIFNSARYLSLEEITALDANIKDFMIFLRLNFPQITVSPKLHMMEDHMIPFITRWRAGCGFFGEQGSMQNLTS